MSRYFLHITPNGQSPIFWRKAQGFAGISVHINLNLLATVLGDLPQTPQTLVSAQSYKINASIGTINLQPFVRTDATGLSALPIGPNLKNMLDYPLGQDDSMNLSLPFDDSTLGIGDSGGGWFRKNDNDSAFHGGWDVTRNSANEYFEVCAVADGVVEGIVKQDNAPIVIKHTRGIREFITIYQHLELSTSSLAVGDTIGRGQFMARISAKPRVPHLHFMVAIKGPSYTTANGKNIPSLWYAIDPFGVYDYYENRTGLTYNYLPDIRPNCFVYRIQGSSHHIQWAGQPVITALPITRNTAYLKIVRMQIRDKKVDFRNGEGIKDVKQCLIWLEGIDNYFFVPFRSNAQDYLIELKLIDLLTECFSKKISIKAEYYFKGKNKFISAAWARRY